MEELGTTAKVKCLLETPEGTLFAGADRLLIFDGVSWTQARAENTPEITSLCMEGNRLWIGGVNEVGYFEKNANGEFVYKSATYRLGERFYGTVHRIFVVGGTIVFVSERKVVQLPLEKGSARIWELPSDPKLKPFLYNGTVYINQTLSGEVKTWALRNDALEPDSSLLGADGHYRSFIGQLGDRLVFGGGWALYEKDQKTGIERRFYADSGELSKAKLTGSSLCKDDSVYIPTLTGGIVVVGLDGETSQITKAVGAASDCCYAITASRAKGVWAATDEGISFVHQSGDSVWFALPGTARAILGDRENLYVSFAQGAFHFTPGKRDELAHLSMALWTRLGSDIYGLSSGRIYRARTGASDFVEWGDTNGFAITSILGSHGTDGILYAGAISAAASRVFMRLDVASGAKSSIEIPEGLGYYLQDKAGRLWISTLAGSVLMLDAELQKGVLQISGKKRSRLTLHEGEPVVLYDGSGFMTAKGEKIHDTDNITGALGTENVEGPAWISGKVDDAVRIGVLERVGTELVWQRKNVPGLRRFKNLGAIYRSGNDLWLGGETGVIQVDTTQLAGPDFALPGAEISVRSVSRKTQRTLPDNVSRLLLANDEQELSIKFRTHVWGLLEPPQFESRLLPVEDEWTSHKYGEVISRRNLPTGQYTLQLRVRHLGAVGPVASYQVWRKLPWYFSYAGITLFAFIGGLLFYGAVKLRTRRIMTRNRELELKIIERTQELARANAAKSEFLAAMSHEIRNPMNGVIGIVKILQEAKLGAREKYYLTTLHRCAEQLRTTVDDVLDFSKIEAGTITLHLDTFDLAESVNAAISAIDLTGDRLELASWTGPHFAVTGDQGKFVQILTNYFNNALKYGVPPSATIDVVVLAEGPQRCRVTITVKNAGPDIPPNEIATLFDSFTRGEFAKRGRIGGSGLGLSICKKFAEIMGGNVGVTSGGGMTVFQLTLPFDLAHTRTAPVVDTTTTRHLHARALAIEDEDYNRLVLGSILQKLGYRVDWACDGKMALQLAEQNGYDLVLTDLVLPDTDGGTLTKDILALSEEPKPPVFAVTAYSTREKEEECLRAGMAGFISKPITVEKLEAALQKWADGRKGAARPIMDQLQEVGTPVSVQQLGKLGPLEIILPDFTRKIQSEWALIDRMLEDREVRSAANAAHKLISAMLLVEADVASDQLRLLESCLRDGALESEIEKVRSICREEIDSVATSLKTALSRRQRINEGQ